MKRKQSTITNGATTEAPLNQPQIRARLATIEVLMDSVIPLFVTPVPCKETLRDWFDKARIPRFKNNPLAKRGGGPAFYSVAAVEKFFRNRMVNA